MSWLDRLTAGFKKTADKVGENITGLVHQQALDTATLDDIEEALIASDLGPAASKRIREAIAEPAVKRIIEGLELGEAMPTSPEREARLDARALGQAELQQRARRLGLRR